ncbi:hypothetical protein JZU46_00140 [bacterium]|nr:hypothetical protein [bacterium]
MEGYIKSKKTSWIHIFKMSVRPGGKIPLQDLYDQYGAKNNLEEADFVTWLKEVKLSGRLDDWQIVEEDSTYESTVTIKEKSETEFTTNTKGEVVARKMSIEDIIALPVRRARELIPTIMDEKLLKYALQSAKPKAGKESLCRILEKRLSEMRIPM